MQSNAALKTERATLLQFPLTTQPQRPTRPTRKGKAEVVELAPLLAGATDSGDNGGGELKIAHYEINLSEHSLLGLTLVNAKGETILDIDFDRISDATPQLKIGSPGPNGELRVATTIFDVAA